MPILIDLTGKQFGVWKVIKKTNKKAPSDGSYLYKCINMKNKIIYFKTSSYLKQFKKRKSQIPTLRGRPRKWIITKVPYIEKEA